MGSLKHFYRNVLRDNTFFSNEFDRIPKLELESHLTVAKYGNFTLSNAVRPSFDLNIIPRQGYRTEHYTGEGMQNPVPVLIASVSAEDLFDTFIDLLDPLGSTVDAVLETSHRRNNGRHTDLYREQIDLPILKSFLYECEEMILNDGCTGVAVLNPATAAEVQFDEHKLLIIYAENLNVFEKILQRHGIQKDETLQFLTEAEHIHTTRNDYERQFRQLQTTLGLDETL
ncbi:MAG: hypothetical protein LBN39_10775 [Planctomycetaceae bacterium]|jgi:hypothetical protein|nr:hypothetical protein [Planctomycetaceae bacterium]